MNRQTLWMTAIEMRYAALRWYRAYLADRPRVGRIWLRDQQDVLQPRDWQYDQDVHLIHAETYAFTTETATAVTMASRSIPGTTRISREMFPHPCGWWWFEQPIFIRGLKRNAEDCCALSWQLAHERHPHVESVETIKLYAWTMAQPVSEDLRTPGRIDPVCVFEEHAWGHSSLDELRDAKCPTDPDEIGTRAASLTIWRFFMAATTWLQQRILETSFGHLERHHRKRLAREHQTPLPSDVKIVELRRTEHEPHHGEPLDVQWHCRWIVSGHWRNQPYKAERKLIYINPYIKGPADQPLKIPSQTVYLVSR